MGYTDFVRFEWDEAKDLSNQRKHGLSFTEAKLLYGPGDDYLLIFDVSNSDVEDRFLAIGEIQRGVPVIVYTEREADLIRIIWARFATKRERERYRKYMDQRR